jgi:predicted dinucleotide-binding enzyme
MVESEWVARALGQPVVKAFNNIFAAHLGSHGVPAGTAGRIALPVAGDDQRSKDLVIRLLDELGFDDVDAGTIAESWRQQPGTPVYASDFDADGVKAALAQAESGKIAEYRAQADEAARAWFA